MQTRKRFVAPNSGEVYYNLTLTGNYEFRGEKEKRRMYVEAKCVCGVIKSYPLRYLKTGNTKSCGCTRGQKLIEASTTHRLSKHPLYSVYQDMKRRCYQPNCKAFKDYGARGIGVCDEWLIDIKSFCDWGMANGYKRGLDLDRKDNNGNYEPDNCRFITRAIGNTNTRRVIPVTAFGETKCIADWTRDKRCSVSQKTLKERITNGRWDIEQAITTPSNDRKKEFSRKLKSVKMVTAWGETKCIVEWSEDERCKVGYSGLKARLYKGWEPEIAISTLPQ